MGKSNQLLMTFKKISLLWFFLPTLILAQIAPKIPLQIQKKILLQNNAIPGGVAVLDFQTAHPNPTGFYYNVKLRLQQIEGQHWQALAGIPLLTKPGKKEIVIQGFTTRKIPFEVKNHTYQSQHITLKGKQKKYLNPNQKHTDRLLKERAILAKARNFFSADALSDGWFVRPVDGVITSPFGFKRFYNGQPRRPHTGLDFAGKLRTPIKAAGAGRVILTGDFFFNGNTIFIDHGRGLISAYIHLNQIQVKQGQMLQRGEIIGSIGQTGRATGAHLHWGVYLNTTAVNPSLFLPDLRLKTH